ncbi:unnamed protein product [Alopecurus aequalis]
MDIILPFDVGGAVELKSFTKGYRGAWFRCKIIEISMRSGQLVYQIEYMDYPEEKRHWTTLYQIHPKDRKKKTCQNREPMLRPSFPQWCWDHIPQDGQKMDVVAVVSSPWKVGDLVDWWHTNCFWTGKIIELLGDGKVKIACPEEPLGEGGCWDADHEDLRPALDWSLEKGWSAPLSQENGESWYTARLITENPDAGISSSDEDSEQSYDSDKEVQKCVNRSFDAPKQEIGKCLNGASVTPGKAMDPDVKHPANTNGRRSMKSQTHSKEEPQKCRSEDPDTSPEAIHPKVQVASDDIGECSMNSQADYPMSPMANSGHSYQLLSTGAQSNFSSFKRLKTSTDQHTSRIDTPGRVYSRRKTECAPVQLPPVTVGEALMRVEELVHRIKRAQDLLQSVDDDGDAPSSRVATPAWKFR